MLHPLWCSFQGHHHPHQVAKANDLCRLAWCCGTGEGAPSMVQAVVAEWSTETGDWKREHRIWTKNMWMVMNSNEHWWIWIMNKEYVNGNEHWWIWMLANRVDKKHSWSVDLVFLAGPGRQRAAGDEWTDDCWEGHETQTYEGWR